MKTHITIALFFSSLFLNYFSFYAQRKCASFENLQIMLQKQPEMQKNIDKIEEHTQEFSKNRITSQRTVVTIPVVFHIVWRSANPVENITDAQVLSQVNALNKDFRKLNTDATSTPALFSAVAADCEIQFCLAQRSPGGTATNGIVHYQSSRSTEWGTNDAVKTAFAPWDPSKYLNIWICHIGSGILGYAQFPGGSSATDGVVVDYRYIGTTGTATAPFHLGRTLTHEVGHWLNLRHIWGDANCGSDFVNDTPPHTSSNGGCPAFPKINNCGGISNTEMTMNFMDYTDDACMYMFSSGQKTRMKALFSTGGARASLLTSDGCQGVPVQVCAVPTQINVSNISTNSAKVTWIPVNGVSSYSLRYKKSSASTWISQNVTNTNFTLTGLSSAVNYSIQVASICSTIQGAYSTSTTFSTSSMQLPCSDNYESNNIISSSAPIGSGTPIKGLLHNSTDEDWFKVTTTSTQKKIKVTLYNLPADYDLFLYSSAGTLLSSSKNLLSTDEVVKYNSGGANAVYYVKVVSLLKKFSVANCYTLLSEISSSNFRTTVENEVQDLAPTENANFIIGPNPVGDALTVYFSDKNAQRNQVTITNSSGYVLENLIVPQNSNQESVIFNTSKYSQGLYFVTVSNGETYSSKKFLIQR
ncbi:MAG: M43 family zinc metalloprotease, partial [Saprospiraceae bacterium]